MNLYLQIKDGRGRGDYLFLKTDFFQWGKREYLILPVGLNKNPAADYPSYLKKSTNPANNKKSCPSPAAGKPILPQNILKTEFFRKRLYPQNEK